MLRGEGFAKPNPRPMFANPPGLLRGEPHADGLRDGVAPFGYFAHMLRGALISLQTGEAQVFAGVNLPRELEGGLARLHAAAVGADVHLHQHVEPNACRARS